MIRIGIGTFIESNQNFDMLDFEERGKPGAPLGAKKRTSNKLNPHNYEAKYGNRNPGDINATYAVAFYISFFIPQFKYMSSNI